MDLAAYLKYCLGYVKMSRGAGMLGNDKKAQELDKTRLNLVALLNLDQDGFSPEPIQLPLFESLNPKDVTEEQKSAYKEERDIARNLEDLSADARNNPFTKQLSLRFGYFKISLPKNSDANDSEEAVDTAPEPLVEGKEGELPLFSKSKPRSRSADNAEMSEMEFPLFSVQIQVERTKSKFEVTVTDPSIEVHLGELEQVLEPNSYSALAQKMGEYETAGSFSLPQPDMGQLLSFWGEVRSVLSLSRAQFDSDSFQLERIKLSLNPRSNYFLSDDLRKLTLLDSSQLEGTALSAWTSDEEMLIPTEEPSEPELFFPFPYDKYQARILRLLANRAGVVQGPPGTGKSQSICNIICHLASQGKTVLFVSQKPQALKVVKDRLKSLGIKNLFGYIPNPSSEILTEEDELDGAGPALARVATAASVMEQTAGRDIDPAAVVNERDEARKFLQADLDREREYCVLLAEFEGLAAQKMEIEDPALFLSASVESVEAVREARKRAATLSSKAITLATCENYSSFDPSFRGLSWPPEQASSALEAIRADWMASGPKGQNPGKIALWWSDRRCRRRQSSSWSKLPAEIVAYLETLLTRSEPRTVVAGYLLSLRDYAIAKECQREAADAEGQAIGLLRALGLSEEAFLAMESRVKEGQKTEEIISSNQRLLQLESAIADNLTSKIDAGPAREVLKTCSEKRAVAISTCLGNRLNERIVQALRGGRQVRAIIAQFGKAFGKSKRAFRTFDRLRREVEQYKVMLNLLPVWIMELEDASRLLPLEPHLFDYVILDEASQCNVAYAMPSMFRAEKALFFGDSLQMRDSTTLFRRNRSFEDLANLFQVPDPLRIKASEGEIQSVLDIAEQRGLPMTALQYHYRSPAELIGFSNDNFYKPRGRPLFPLRHTYTTFQDTRRIMLVHKVEQGGEDQGEKSLRENVAEARFIVDLVKTIRRDPKLAQLSIGVLSFFNDQARLMRKALEDAGEKVDGQNLKVAVIEGIQGDEKDIIIYSCVIRTPQEKRQYQPLTGEGGDLRAAASAGRVNVAFSRARLQAHCVTSMELSAFPVGIWLGKYLNYADKYGQPAAVREGLNPFDSIFEEQFYAAAVGLLGPEFVVRNQVPSCGFKLDFVISSLATGRALAIECDGPMHFQDEGETLYVASDMERQDVLERAGWEFYRLRYSDWLVQRDKPQAIMNEIRNALST